MAIRTIDRPSGTYDNHGVYWVERPLPQHDEDDARWAEFCRTIVTRIEAEREDVPPVCNNCETIQTTERRCARCKNFKPFSEFPRDRTKKLGHAYYCKDCTQIPIRARRLEARRQMVRQFRKQVAS